LFHYTIRRAGRKIVARLARDGDQTLFGRVFVLSMATTSPCQVPAVLFNQMNRFTDLHPRILPRSGP
jgi:hypothetical protein